MKRIIFTLVLALGLAAPAVMVAAAQASALKECGTYNIYAHHWTSTTHPDFSGFTPVANLTTRNVRCSDARPFSLYVSRRSTRHYHSFNCRVTQLGTEDYDIRCTRGSQVIHWQGGA